MRQAGGKAGRELEVEVCEEGPEGGEEEEVDLGGGGVVDVIVAVGVAVEEVVGVVDGWEKGVRALVRRCGLEGRKRIREEIY